MKLFLLVQKPMAELVSNCEILAVGVVVRINPNDRLNAFVPVQKTGEGAFEGINRYTRSFGLGYLGDRYRSFGDAVFGQQRLDHRVNFSSSDCHVVLSS